jgi:hypothetical protein
MNEEEDGIPTNMTLLGEKKKALSGAVLSVYLGRLYFGTQVLNCALQLHNPLDGSVQALPPLLSKCLE